MYGYFSCMHVFVSHSCLLSTRPVDDARTPSSGVTDSTEFLYVLERKLATMEESQVHLTAKIFSNKSFPFFIISCPRQPNHGQSPGADLIDLSSPPGERISLR